MKPLKFFLFLCGIPALTTLSCQKSNEASNWQEITVSQTTPVDCGCNSTLVSELTDFKTSVTASFDNTKLTNDQVNVISLDTVAKTCVLIRKNGTMFSFARICNYPEEMKNWDLKNGKTVDVTISGKVYKSCNEFNSPTNYTYADIVLNKLLKEIKND